MKCYDLLKKDLFVLITTASRFFYLFLFPLPGKTLILSLFLSLVGFTNPKRHGTRRMHKGKRKAFIGISTFRSNLILDLAKKLY